MIAMMQLNVRIPLEVYEWLKANANEHCTTMSRIGKKIICEYYESKK